MRYVHGVVATNRPDLLKLAVASIEPIWDRAFLLDNSPGGVLGTNFEWPIPVVRPSVPLSCAQSMNFLYRVAKENGCDVFGYQHHDARFCTVADCHRFMQECRTAFAGGRQWSCVWTTYDVISAYNVAAVDDVGEWDVHFPEPNYMIDRDWFRRAETAMWTILRSSVRSEHMSGGSQTLRADPRRQFFHDQTGAWNYEYYRRKWGGLVGQETYRRPWGGSVPGRGQ